MNAHAAELARCEADVRAMPARVAVLPRRQETELARLWRAAIAADKAVQEHLRTTLPIYGREDLEHERLQNLAADAADALREYLWTEHRLSRADLREWPL